MAIVDAFELNLGHGLVGAARASSRVGAAGRDAEHAASIRKQLIAGLDGAGVEYLDGRNTAAASRPVMGKPVFVAAGITCGAGDDAS